MQGNRDHPFRCVGRGATLRLVAAAARKTSRAENPGDDTGCISFHGDDFVQAAKKLGAWIDDGQYPVDRRPKTLSAARAIEVLAFEASLAAVAAGNVAKGVRLTDEDRKRLYKCANRIIRISQEYTS